MTRLERMKFIVELTLKNYMVGWELDRPLRDSLTERRQDLRRMLCENKQ